MKRRYLMFLILFSISSFFLPKISYAQSAEVMDLYSKGTILAARAEFREAISYYDKALSLAPNFADAWQKKGTAFYHLREYKEALSCFDKAIALNPANDAAWFNKALTLEALKRNNEAIFAYQKAIELNQELRLAVRQDIRNKLK